MKTQVQAFAERRIAQGMGARSRPFASLLVFFCRRVAEAHGRDAMTRGVGLLCQTYFLDENDNTLGVRACDRR
jgi:hypothetical protein